ATPTTTTEDEGDGGQPTEPGTEGTTEAPQEDQVSDTPTPENNEALAAAEAIVEQATGELAVTASARPVAPSLEVAPRPKVAYVAGADQHRYTQGMELDRDRFAEAWGAVRLAPSQNGPVRAVVASLPG